MVGSWKIKKKNLSPSAKLSFVSIDMLVSQAQIQKSVKKYVQADL